MMRDVAILTICRTCRANEAIQPDIPVAGARLLDEMTRLIAVHDDVVLNHVECLAQCAKGCTASIAMAGKWAYVLGNLTPGMANDLAVYARAYAASKTGTIMPSRRPASLANMILGRIPALDPATSIRENEP